MTVVMERAEVALTQSQVVCAAHLAPFRAKWPLGWDIFARLVAQSALDSPMLQTGLTDPRYWKYEALFWELSDKDHFPNVTLLPETRASVTRIRQMLFDRPACEWNPPATLMGAYKAAGIGEMGLCSVCRILADGAPFPVKSGQGVAVIPHVCWRCVVRKAAVLG